MMNNQPPPSERLAMEEEIERNKKREAFEKLKDSVREAIQTDAPIIPPNSKYFNYHGGNKLIVELPDRDFYLEDTPPEYRFIVAALALAEWDGAFGQGVSPEECMVLRKACQYWREWRI